MGSNTPEFVVNNCLNLLNEYDDTRFIKTEQYFEHIYELCEEIKYDWDQHIKGYIRMLKTYLNKIKKI